MYNQNHKPHLDADNAEPETPAFGWPNVAAILLVLGSISVSTYVLARLAVNAEFAKVAAIVVAACAVGVVCYMATARARARVYDSEGDSTILDGRSLFSPMPGRELDADSAGQEHEYATGDGDQEAVKVNQHRYRLGMRPWPSARQYHAGLRMQDLTWGPDGTVLVQQPVVGTAIGAPLAPLPSRAARADAVADDRRAIRNDYWRARAQHLNPDLSDDPASVAQLKEILTSGQRVGITASEARDIAKAAGHNAQLLLTAPIDTDGNAVAVLGVRASNALKETEMLAHALAAVIDERDALLGRVIGQLGDVQAARQALASGEFDTFDGSDKSEVQYTVIEREDGKELIGPVIFTREDGSTVEEGTHEYAERLRQAGLHIKHTTKA